MFLSSSMTQNYFLEDLFLSIKSNCTVLLEYVYWKYPSGKSFCQWFSGIFSSHINKVPFQNRMELTTDWYNMVINKLVWVLHIIKKGNCRATYFTYISGLACNKARHLRLNTDGSSYDNPGTTEAWGLYRTIDLRLISRDI